MSDFLSVYYRFSLVNFEEPVEEQLAYVTGGPVAKYSQEQTELIVEHRPRQKIKSVEIEKIDIEIDFFSLVTFLLLFALLKCNFLWCNVSGIAHPLCFKNKQKCVSFFLTPNEKSQGVSGATD